MKISKTLLAGLAFGVAISGASAQALQFNLPPRFPTETAPSAKQVDLQKRADAGDLDAEATLAWMYVDGEIRPIDYDKALLLMQGPAEKGNASAQESLFYMYTHRTGTPDDIAKALYWESKAANSGRQSAQLDFGVALQKYTPSDGAYAEAIHWFEVAAAGPDDKMSSQAALDLARTYVAGTGVKVDEEKALYWLKVSVDKNNPESMNVLGLMYRDGTGVTKDAKAAYKYFKMSANIGNPIGQDLLGDCYADGVGTDVDFVKAYVWYDYASRGGSFKDTQKENALRSKMPANDVAKSEKIISHHSFFSPDFDK